MRRLKIALPTLLLLGATVVIGCGKTTETPPVSQTTPSKAKADSAAMVNIDWCIVSGETLGSMGDPVSYTYKDREMKFCCKSCVKDFEANPIGYLARLDSAQAGKLKQPGHEGHSH